MRLKEISLDAGMGLAELALRFALSMDAIDSVLVGVERVEQLNENIRIRRKEKLSEDILRRIVQVGDALRPGEQSDSLVKVEFTR